MSFKHLKLGPDSVLAVAIHDLVEVVLGLVRQTPELLRDNGGEPWSLLKLLLESRCDLSLVLPEMSSSLAETITIIIILYPPPSTLQSRG